MTELSGLPRTIGVADASGFARGASQNLRTLAIAGGLAASLLFVVIGVRYELQMYADGSLFSYAVAVQDAWAFHCHNIAGRLSVYLFAFAPAEAYIRLTGDAQGGVALYGLLFLSVLVAPKFTPRRLVVHPKSNYFWLSCETATENRNASRSVPVQTRDLIRAYSCLHRWRRTDSLAGK